MKTMGIILAVFFTGFLPPDLQAQKATIVVIIENVGSREGQVLGSLHTAETFLKGPGIINVSSEAGRGRVVLTFEDVEPGIYAITSMHDLNGNYQMDYKADGMPGEPWTMSGNSAKGGLPLFSQAKFEVRDELALQLVLRFN